MTPPDIWHKPRPMNRFLTSCSVALIAAPLLAVACGGAPQPPKASDPVAEPTTSAKPEAIEQSPGASAVASAAPAPTAAPTAAPKSATAADAAAACLATATYDKKIPNTLTFSVKNTSAREVKMCWLEFYLYDKAGKQLAHEGLPNNYKIAPGESEGQPFEFSDLDKQIGGKPVATIETVISSARFSDGAEFSDKSVAPDQRPRSAKK